MVVESNNLLDRLYETKISIQIWILVNIGNMFLPVKMQLKSLFAWASKNYCELYPTPQKTKTNKQTNKKQ